MGTRNRSLFKEEKCFFVTTVCYQHFKLLKNDVCKEVLCSSISFLNKKYNSCILGYVIMPNHFHFILYFKELNHLSDYMRDMKKFTAVKIRQELDKLGEEVVVEKIRYNEVGRAFKTWEDRFDDVYIRDKRLLEIKLDYIHANPLQEHWSLVKLPEEYVYSSARFYEKGEQSGMEVEDYRNYY